MTDWAVQERRRPPFRGSDKNVVTQKTSCKVKWISGTRAASKRV